MKIESEKDVLRESSRLEELKDGDYVVTTGGDISQQDVPPWYDAKLFSRAKRVYRDYFASVNFSHLCGLLLSFYFTKNIETLRSTGESETKFTLFHRYLATIRHVQKWYEGDVWDKEDPAHRSLATVRSMHARVAKKMALKNDGIVYVSQWDMAVTQWAFVGPMVLFKSNVGLHGCSDEDYKALIHFWRVIGYLLGIEDKYNLCDGDYQQVLAACKTLLEKEYKGKVVVADPASVSMGRNVITALNIVDKILTWESMANYIHDLVNIPCPESMSLLDRVCYWLTHLIMRYVIQIPSLRLLFNDFTRWKFDMADRKDEQFMYTKKYVTPNVMAG